MVVYIYTYIYIYGALYQISFLYMICMCGMCWLVGFYGISTLIGHSMSNPLYIYLLNIYDLAGLGFMAYQQL